MVRHVSATGLRERALQTLNAANRYGLAVATSIMFWMLVKRPPSDVARRVRMNKNW